MSKLVNVVRSDGTVVAVPEEVALAATSGPQDGIGPRLESAGEYQARQDQAASEEAHSGIASSLAAAGEGALDTVTFGGYGLANEAFNTAGDISAGEEPGHAYRERAAAHPVERFVGELAGMMVPGDEFSAVGAAKAVGEIGEKAAGKLVGRALEGSILGAGASMAQAQVSNDPLTVESLVEGATIGGVLGYGQTVIGDALTSRAAQAALKDLELEESENTVKKASEVFQTDSPAWNELKAARDGAQDTIAKLNKDIEKEVKSYTEFTSGGGDFEKTAREFDKALNEMREIVRKEYPRATMLEGEESFSPEAKAANEFVADASKDLQRARAAMRSGDGDTALGILHDIRDRITGPDTLNAEADTAPIPASETDFTGRINPREMRRAGLARERAVQSLDYRANPPPATPPELTPVEGWQKMARQDLDTARMKAVLTNGDTVGMGAKEVPSFPQLNNPLPEAAPLPEFRNPFTEVKLPELPVRTPRTPLPLDELSIPKSLDGLAKMHADTVARWAGTMSDGEKQAVAKLASELGLTARPGDGPEALLAGVHAQVKDYVAALKSAAEEKPGLISLARKWAKTALKYAVAAKTGGLLPGSIMQAAGRAAAGTAIDAVMTQTETAMLSRAAISAREGVIGRTRQIIAKYGTKAGKGLRDLAPVTSYLSRSFPSGDPDNSTKDLRKLALRRTKEILAAAQSAPNNSFAAIQPLVAAPNNIALAIHNQVVGGVQHLAATAPRDPGLATRLFSTDWTPTQQQAMELAYRLEAAQRPLDALARHLMGDGHPASADTLWKVWSGLMNNASVETSLAAPDIEPSFAADRAYSGLMSTPIGFSDPRILASIQGMYLPKPQQQAAPTGTPQDGGRPPATGRNPVAGSDVSKLISQ